MAEGGGCDTTRLTYLGMLVIKQWWQPEDDPGWLVERRERRSSWDVVVEFNSSEGGGLLATQTW